MAYTKILNLISEHIIDRGLEIANILKRHPRAKKRYQLRNNKRKIWMTALAIVAMRKINKSRERMVFMDTDSFEI